MSSRRMAGVSGAVRRVLALAMALTAVISIRPAHSDPGDIFTVAAPAVSAAAPTATAIGDGDASVSSQTGALTYSYPIAVPSGRAMQPGLSLSYSSQAAIYGGLASGWSLAGIPMITQDTTEGRLLSSSFTVPVKNYTSSMASGLPLTPVDEPGTAGSARYRAQHDSGWVRYERFSTGDYWWLARFPDGSTFYFGDKDAHTSSCTIVSDGYAPLTRAVDGFGNSVDYMYQAGVDGECRLKAITWGHNTNAGVGYFAAIELDYASSPPICAGVNVGSQTSFRTGVKIVTGASQVTAIRIAAFPPQAGGAVTIAPIPASADHTRTIALTYSEGTSGATSSCFVGHAAFRALTKIQETAVGVDSPSVTLPAVDLAYGEADLSYPSPTSSESPPWPLASGSPPFRHNLGWGYRPTSAGAWPTVEAMMVDLDGDGLIDRLVSEPYLDPTNTDAQLCRARWYRNRGPAHAGVGQFEAAGYIDMPTLKWATDLALGGPDQYCGGAHAGDNSLKGLEERCSLNYQRTGYLNSRMRGEAGCVPAGSTCPASNYCEGPGIVTTRSDCRPAKTSGGVDSVFAWRWFDINGDSMIDLIGSPIKGGVTSYDLQWGNGADVGLGGPPAEPAIFGAFPPCPSTPYSASTSPSSDPYTMCNGMFPWMVYLNHGNGVFGKPRTSGGGGEFGGTLPPLNTGGSASCQSTVNHANWGPLPDQILYQPIALETATGDSSILSSPIGQVQGTVDIDGDGYPDAVRRTSSSSWSVYRNDTTGRFVPSAGTVPFSFPTGTNYSIFKTEMSGTGTPQGTEGLTDVHGDGLADHWTWSASVPATAGVNANDGVQFRFSDGVTVDRPGTDGYPWVIEQSGGFVCSGTRVDSRRPIDVDGDGRVDIARFATGTTLPEVQFNQGGSFGGATSTTGFSAGLLRRIMVRSELGEHTCGGSEYRWELRSDMVDLDGDGINEAVDFGNEFTTPFMWTSRVATPTQPPRLLVEIKNNRGATTTIAYDSMNGAAVEQHPELGKASPHTNWVVKSLTTADDLSDTTALTSFQYFRPRFHADRRGRFAFRGFDEVHTTSQSGAKTIERFSYVPDWSGRLATKIVMRATTGTAVHSIDETSWEERTLFAGAVKTFHPIVSDHWTCWNGQDEAACRANTDTRTRTVATLSALTSTTTSAPTPLLWQETSSRLQAGASQADGDRVTTRTFAFAADTSTYRLRPRRTTQQHQATGSLVTFAQSETIWDASLRVPVDEDVWFSEPETACSPTALHCARTHRVFDMTTGNVLEHYKPEQWAAGGIKKTTMQYDARKLFVATEVNEANHQREYLHEYGTGTKLQTTGPNVATCSLSIPVSCPPNTPFKEEHRIRVDGLGRMIERFETFNSGASSYQSFKVEANAFVDGPAASVTNQSALDWSEYTNEVTYTQDTTELDGLGRPIKKTVYVFGSAPADQVTRFFYRDDGSLREVQLPDPTANDASLVSYTYEFDSLGRPTQMRRPDTTSLSQRSGVELSYDGLVTTTSEVTGVAGGAAAVTRTANDAFGRLVRVEELLDGVQVPRWSTTEYAYDPADRVQQVNAPEQVTTTLAHDMGDRRVAISRAGRTWAYGYDRNGNMSSVTTPCSPMPMCAAAHVSTTDFDDLDRPISKLIAPRALSTSDLALFGSDSELFSYDTGINVKGQLQAWQMLGPGATAATSGSEFGYNAQGQRQYTWQITRAAGYSALERSFLRFYWLSGAAADTYYRDIVGTQNCTSGGYSKVNFDRRGLPWQVTVVPCLYEPGMPVSYLLNTRNVAGLVTRRHSQNGSGAYTPAESNWTYDKLGRVTSQVVSNGAALEQVVRQDLSYFGNDDPKQLEHWLGAGNHKTFAFGYDSRHQLTSANETSTAGYFTAAYEYGDAGRFERVTHATTGAPGSNVVPRDVLYEYLDADRERVTGLVSLATGEPFATYEYDPAGNQTLRCYGPLLFGVCSGESTSYLYDGKDQLRRAIKRNTAGVVLGSEEYWYDHAGQRNLVVKRDGAGAKTEMIWFLEDTEAHYDAGGTVTRAFGHVTLGTPVVRLDRSSDAPSVVEYQFHGLANNTIAAVDHATGTVNASFSYAPFGEVLEATNAGGASQGTAVHKRRFNDKFEDDVSGLSYYGARYYDKTLIGWTQADPLYRFAPDAAWEAPRRANLYGFTLNNPLRYMDPDGRDSAPLTSELQKTIYLAAQADTIALKDTQSSGVGSSLSDSIGLVILVGLACQTCAVVLAAGMMSDGTEGGSMVAAGCAGAACMSKTSAARAASAEIGAAESSSVRVGRWMSEGEYSAMKKSGYVQESTSGTTHVLSPADGSGAGFARQAKNGSVYVEFDVPMTSVKQTAEGWAKIPGPNSLEGRLAKKKGVPPPQMPAAKNISPVAKKEVDPNKFFTSDIENRSSF